MRRFSTLLLALFFRVLNPQTIRVTVPVRATTGPIAVTNAGGTTVLAHGFSVK
jgi:hypothetical protein